MVVPEFKFAGEKTTGGWVRAHDLGWCGAEGLIEGLREVLDAKGAKTTTWVVADFHTESDAVHSVVSIGFAMVDGEPQLRYCGEKGAPTGAGSYSLPVRGLSLAEAAAVLALGLCVPLGAHIYRQPSTLQIGWELDGSISQ